MNTSPLQHDLSFNETKVSFDLLLKTVNIAVGYAKHACERDLGKAQTESFAGNVRELAYVTKDLAKHAADLALAADTLHVLTESKSREVFTLIGKPPVVQ
jgi:hypothetical protein